MINVGIIGGTGYTGGELLRLLATHPKTEVKVVTSRREEGKEVYKVHPHLKKFYDLYFIKPELKYFDDCDVVFVATPHGESMNYVPELIEMGIKVVDLSADYRLEKEIYEKVYGKKHKHYIKAVYGLTEIHREEIGNANLIANPGCYPTGAILAVAPLAEKELIERVVFDAKSGISGAGAEPTAFTHYPNVHEAIIPYKVTEHRHYYEMLQELKAFQEDIKISFTPQVFPASRGILTTSHVFLRGELTKSELIDIYQNFYNNCYFIRLQEDVKLSYVRGSNFCDIAIFISEDRLEDRAVIISAIDNLIKGASGQAIQNMNVMFGLKEETGLNFPPIFP